MNDSSQLHALISKMPQSLLDKLAHRSCKDPLTLDTLKMLIELRYVDDPRTTLGESLMHTALRCKNMEAFAYLKKKGYNINEEDDLGRTPLHHLCSSDQYLDMVRFAIEQGAILDARDERLQTPLHIAAQLGAKGIVELLLENGLDPRIPDDIGQEPLTLAYKNGFKDVAVIIAKAKENMRMS